MEFEYDKFDELDDFGGGLVDGENGDDESLDDGFGGFDGYGVNGVSRSDDFHSSPPRASRTAALLELDAFPYATPPSERRSSHEKDDTAVMDRSDDKSPAKVASSPSDVGLQPAAASATKKRKSPVQESSNDDSQPEPKNLKKEPKPDLSWSVDAKNSATYTDWAIEITALRQSPTIYHVHKCILVTGERNSAYFAKAFLNESSKSNDIQTSTTRVKLCFCVARDFSHLLDYIYLSPGEVQSFLKDLEPKKTAALWYLADYFGVRSLPIEEKVMGDMSIDSVHCYYVWANLLRHDPLKKTSTHFLAKEIANNGITIDSSALFENVTLWLDVLAHDCVRSGGEVSLRLSKVVAALYQNSPDTMDLPTFQMLTDEKILPTIDSSVALVLCDMEESLEADTKPGGKDDSGGEVLSSLQQRCAIAFSHSPPTDDDKELVSLLNQRKKSFCVQVCVMSMKNQREHANKN
ncbi:expressed unknown protein [Seminavis robusta]|uniref:BTB domain-containing protein n=1 Tax=Seminavis robusta TaxID=568900 RepID=A0A9N8F4F2_9STRA|nr:expressed unknown protein [Seminavis robusta]|eukprot:Sro3584_g349360.1 n/a (464) ;mRNA; f:1812-3203